MVYLICMGAQEQIQLHCKAITYQIQAKHYSRFFFHVKGIFRAIFVD